MSIEILLKAQNTHGSYEKGFFISIKDGIGHDWGKKVTFPNFIIVRINDVSKENLNYLISTSINSDYKVEESLNQFEITARVLDKVGVVNYLNDFFHAKDLVISNNEILLSKTNLYNVKLNKIDIQVELVDKFQKTLKVRRYRFEPTEIDKIIKNKKDFIEMTKNEFLKNIEDLA